MCGQSLHCKCFFADDLPRSGAFKRIANPKVGKKGNQVIVEGSIQSNSYEKNGEKVFKTNLVVQEFEILSFAKDSK